MVPLGLNWVVTRWLATLARVSFYDGHVAATEPRRLLLAGRQVRAKVLLRARLGGMDPTQAAEDRWLVVAGGEFFRVCRQGERVRVERWWEDDPPSGLADLLA